MPTMMSTRTVCAGTAAVLGIVLFMTFCWSGSQGSRSIPKAEQVPFEEEHSPEVLKTTRVTGITNDIARIPIPAFNEGRQFAQSESSPEQSAIRVLVVDEFGAPIQGAAVLEQSDGESRCLGETDETGEFLLAPVPPTWIRLLAEKEGHASSTTYLGPSSSTPKRITLVLGIGSSISGTVIYPDGESAGEGIGVLAWPSSLLAPDYVAADSIANGHSCPRSTTTNHDGSFIINDLKSGQKYALIAGGAGLGTLRDQYGYTTGTTDARLVVAPLYSAVLRLQDSHGQAVIIPRGLKEEFYLKIDNQLDEYRRVYPGSSLGWRLALPPAPEDDSEIRLVYSGPSALKSIDSVGPIFIEVSLPGYESEHSMCSITRADGWARPQLVALQREEGNLGRLVVHFRGLSALDRAWINPAMKMGDLFLIPQERSSMVPQYGGQTAHGFFEYTLQDAYSGQQAVDGIPYGIYEVKVFFRNGGFRLPADDRDPAIVVVDSPENELYIECADLGELEIKVFDVLGQPYCENLTFDLGEGEVEYLPTGEMQVVIGGGIAFTRPPYVVKGLEPGNYHVFISRPNWAMGQEPYFSVEVRGGERTQATIRPK